MIYRFAPKPFTVQIGSYICCFSFSHSLSLNEGVVLVLVVVVVVVPLSLLRLIPLVASSCSAKSTRIRRAAHRRPRSSRARQEEASLPECVFRSTLRASICIPTIRWPNKKLKKKTTKTLKTNSTTSMSMLLHRMKSWPLGLESRLPTMIVAKCPSVCATHLMVVCRIKPHLGGGDVGGICCR
jgi:hypothetical protein